LKKSRGDFKTAQSLKITAHR